MNNEKPTKGIPLEGPFLRNGQASGRGRFIQLIVSSGAAGSTITVPHGLGRVPQMLLLLDAGDGPYPAWSWPLASRTKMTIGVNMPAAGTYLFWVN